MEGEVLAALYSYGSCKKSKELEIHSLLAEFLKSKSADLLGELRKRLKELKPYPYYQLIAKENNITDPFSQKVVEAYWTGNELLEKFPSPKKPHHNFAILDDAEIFASHFGWEIMAANLNLCRVSVGKIKRFLDNDLIVETCYIFYQNKSFFEGPAQEKLIKGGLLSFFKKPRVGDTISFHWGEAREILPLEKKERLQRVNRQFINFLNKQGTL